jgi:fermentation-respiration switch protein FrsA (DUF1100 family)
LVAALLALVITRSLSASNLTHTIHSLATTTTDEFPGYGCFPGSPTEALLNACIQRVYSFVREQLHVPADRIVLFGQSIGTGPTLWLANQLAAVRVAIGGVVLQSPFTSINAIVKNFGTAGSLASTVFVSERWNSLEAIKVVTAPVLLLHGLCDDLIPAEHSKQLYDAVRSAI